MMPVVTDLPPSKPEQNIYIAYADYLDDEKVQMPISYSPSWDALLHC
jgi:hypothetical protein